MSMEMCSHTDMLLERGAIAKQWRDNTADMLRRCSKLSQCGVVRIYVEMRELAKMCVRAHLLNIRLTPLTPEYY